jgi:hypothetical protein
VNWQIDSLCAIWAEGVSVPSDVLFYSTAILLATWLVKKPTRGQAVKCFIMRMKRVKLFGLTIDLVTRDRSESKVRARKER